jgi:outer membrane protein assembly factor BamB
VAAAFTAPASWPAQLTKKWAVTVGAGHASPVVAGNRVILHSRVGNREIVATYELTSGKPLWQDAVDAPYTMNPAATGHGPGPKSTPTVADGRVFTVRHQRHLLRARPQQRQAAVAEGCAEESA